MFPAFDVVALAVRVVLEGDGGQKVLLCQRRVQRHDLVVECHYAALTIDAEKYVNAPLEVPYRLTLV